MNTYLQMRSLGLLLQQLVTAGFTAANTSLGDKECLIKNKESVNSQSQTLVNILQSQVSWGNCVCASPLLWACETKEITLQKEHHFD